ncbi:hypothetical protein F5X68DRAFT_19964 [Plectosphaerella plurivora]|uniref:Uncharacterized protein n=1 Tax=Plectosphaerella plurivora TaxID=936078 RepID=A0A9P9AAK5_9PEZI|nr:hypothetical protein F5X68DRAFT_19964 [Plectosphaerella plurivora]
MHTHSRGVTLAESSACCLDLEYLIQSPQSQPRLAGRRVGGCNGSMAWPTWPPTTASSNAHVSRRPPPQQLCRTVQSGACQARGTTAVRGPLRPALRDHTIHRMTCFPLPRKTSADRQADGHQEQQPCMMVFWYLCSVEGPSGVRVPRKRHSSDASPCNHLTRPSLIGERKRRSTCRAAKRADPDLACCRGRRLVPPLSSPGLLDGAPSTIPCAQI